MDMYMTLLKQYLKDQEISFELREDDGVICFAPSSYGFLYQVQWVFNEEPFPAFQTQVLAFSGVEDEQRSEVLSILNYLNNQYSFLNFTLSEEDICANFFLMMYEDEELAHEQIEHTLTMMIDIVDEAMKEIVRVVMR